MTNTNTIALNAMCLENDLAKVVKVLKVPIPFSTTNQTTVTYGDLTINRDTNPIRKISRKATPNAVAIRSPGKKQRVTHQDRRARFSRVRPRLRLKVSFIKHFFNTVMYSSSTEEANSQTSGRCIVKL